MTEKELAKELKRLEKQMLEHAKNLEFEKAAQTRDQLALLRAARIWRERRRSRARRRINSSSSPCEQGAAMCRALSLPAHYTRQHLRPRFP